MADATTLDEKLKLPGTPTKLTQYQLAVGVAKHVELRNVSLKRMSAELKVPLDVASKAIESDHSAAKVTFTPTYALTDSDQALTVTIEFLISVSAGETPSEILTVGASFELSYGLDSPPPMEAREKFFGAFAHINGTYNAWPYLREVVQSTTARMTLPPVVLPVFRVTPDMAQREALAGDRPKSDC